MSRMWGRNSRCLVLTILAIFIIPSSFGLRINEIELNPEGKDSGNEWIELYTENEENISGCSIKNYDNDSISLVNLFSNNFSFSGYLVIEFESQWLDNSDEKVYLYLNNSLKDESALLEDSENNAKSWQYCNGDWNFQESNKDSENNCESGQEESNTSDTKEEYLEADWKDEEIVNGKEFEIEIKAFNLKDKEYNLKVYIKSEEEIISDRKTNEGWKSGNYYIDNFFEGPGTSERDLKLRIREEYRNYSGSAEIFLKFEDIEYLLKKDIEIIEKEVENSTVLLKNSTNKTDNINQKNNEKIIRLNSPKDINSKNFKQYKSKTQYIKDYSIYGFALFCVFFIMVLLSRIKNG